MNYSAQQDFALAFLSILFEGAPFILLGTLISGWINVYLPSGTMDRLLPKNRSLAIFASGFLGMLFPVCECAVVPVIRRLIGKGLPLGCALSYMIAAPIVNPITALSTWKAFQGQAPWAMTCGRCLLGYLIAVIIGLIVNRISMLHVIKKSVVCKIDAYPFEKLHSPKADSTEKPVQKKDDSRLIAAMRSAQKDFVDVGIYFAIGVSITALFNTGIAPGAKWLDGLAGNLVIAPAALMVLAFILSLCSTSDAFIAATLAKFSWSAKLAFLVFGPIMDVKLLFLYQTFLRRKLILLMAIFVFVSIWLLSMATEQWLGNLLLK